MNNLALVMQVIASSLENPMEGPFKRARAAVCAAEAGLELLEKDAASQEALQPAKAECDRLGAQLNALEPEQFGDDLVVWEAACEEILKRMKAPSDALYEACKVQYEAREHGKALLREARLHLVRVCRDALPRHAVVDDLFEQALSGKLLDYPGSHFDKLVDVCLRWDGKN